MDWVQGSLSARRFLRIHHFVQRQGKEMTTKTIDEVRRLLDDYENGRRPERPMVAVVLWQERQEVIEAEISHLCTNHETGNVELVCFVDKDPGGDAK
jgi:hypothetical protein